MHISKRAAAATACLVVATACGSGGSGSGGSGSGGSGGGSGSTTSGANLEIAVFSPFSGPNSDYGFYEFAGCPPAVNLINAAGGVLGDKLHCTIVDNRGDPADAVPAAQQMLATSSNLVAVIDGDSGLLSATVPLFNRAQVTDVSCGGDVAFDHNKYPYFWRTIPGDDVSGYALAAWAKKQAWSSTVAVFANDQAAQGNVPGLVTGAKNLGVKISANEAIALDQTSYNTEVQKVAAAHPQAVLTEEDPQTAGVFFSQLSQAGVNVPIVGTSGTLSPNYDKALTAAIGAANFKKDFRILTLYTPSSGPAWETYKNALLAAGSQGQVKNASQYTDTVYSEAPYDNVNLIALAMLAAHSTKPSVYNSYIPKVADGGPGAVVVHNFADGKKALEAGKSISYVGVTGAIHFDQYHNSPGVFAAMVPAEHNKVLGVVSPQEVSAAEGH